LISCCIRLVIYFQISPRHRWSSLMNVVVLESPDHSFSRSLNMYIKVTPTQTLEKYCSSLQSHANQRKNLCS
jgi:hypothetical protein